MAQENVHAIKNWVTYNIPAVFNFEPMDRSFYISLQGVTFQEILNAFKSGSNIILKLTDTTSSVYPDISLDDYKDEIPSAFSYIHTLTSVALDETKIYFLGSNEVSNWEFTISSNYNSVSFNEKKKVTSYKNLPNKPINVQEVEINDYEYNLDTSFDRFADTYGSTLYHIHTGDSTNTHLDFYLISFSFSEDQEYCKQTLYDASSQDLLTRSAIYDYETSSWNWSSWQSRLTN